MTVVSEIVVQAFREGNFTAVGQTTTAEELIEAVPRLNNYISALFGIEIGEHYRDWYVPGAWDPAQPLRYPLTPDGSTATSADPYQRPPANVRLISKITSAKTIYFPATPNDGARMSYIDVGATGLVTLDGNGRLIEGSTTLSGAVAVPPETAGELSGRKWFYRADLGNWLRITSLTESSEVPLPEEFDDLLVTGLAIRLAPRFGIKIDDSIALRNADMLSRLKKRYKQSEQMPASTAELRSHFRDHADISGI